MKKRNNVATVSTIGCTSVIPFGVVGSTLGITLSQKNRDTTVISKRCRSIIIGSLLGDGSLDIRGTGKNPMFVLVQTLRNFEYVWSMYREFSNLCRSLPQVGITTRRETRHYYVRLWTRSYFFLIEFYEKFYNTSNNKRTKVVDIEYLLLNINELSLAI